MKRVGFTLVLLGVLALPTAAAAKRSEEPRNPSKQCKALREAPDKRGFRRAVGAGREKRARHGKCVSERAKLKRLRHRLEREAFDDSVRECKAERAADPAAFELKYGGLDASGDPSAEGGEKREPGGEGGEKRDPAGEDGEKRRPSGAFATCVLGKVKEALAALRGEFKNAVKECKAERSEDREAFRERYGTNRNGRNALGKCVSGHVTDGDEAEPGTGERDPEGDRPKETDPEGAGDGPKETEGAPGTERGEGKV
jgi:hypothetical protein